MKKLLTITLVFTIILFTGCTEETTNNQNNEPEINYEDLNDLEKAVYDSQHATGYHVQAFHDLGQPIGIIENNVDVNQGKKYVPIAEIYYYVENEVEYQIE